MDTDLKKLQSYAKSKYEVLAVVNKSDICSYESLYPKLAKLNSIKGLAEIFVVSAKTGKDLPSLKNAIIQRLKDEIEYFPRDSYRAQDVKFDLAELIREKILWLLNDEIPHGVGVEIDSFENENGLARISATIYCEKQSHKSIIIGAKGAMLKKIGTESRLAMEKYLHTKVYLDLFVKVKLNWRVKVKVDNV